VGGTSRLLASGITLSLRHHSRNVKCLNKKASRTARLRTVRD
jgi:hypothetical protein